MDNPTFASALSAARDTYGALETVDEHHDKTVLEFVARSAMVYRTAKQEPELYRRVKLDTGIKDREGLRSEIVAIRVAAGNAKLQQPHWADAVAFLHAPPNGDPPPDCYQQAFAYLKQRGGVRQLSDLWRGYQKGKEAEVIDTEKAVDDLLFDITPDFSAARYYQEGQDDFTSGGYALAIVRLDKAADGWILHGSDKQLIRTATRIKKRSTLREGVDAYVQRMRREALAEVGLTETAEDEPRRKVAASAERVHSLIGIT